MPVYTKYTLWCDGFTRACPRHESDGCLGVHRSPGNGLNGVPTSFPDMETLTRVATRAGWLIREQGYPRFLCPRCRADYEAAKLARDPDLLGLAAVVTTCN